MFVIYVQSVNAAFMGMLYYVFHLHFSAHSFILLRGFPLLAIQTARARAKLKKNDREGDNKVGLGCQGMLVEVEKLNGP